jgi:hypothetical protein
MLLQANSARSREPAGNSDAHAFRGTVSPHEKLLLLAILLVVAGWISFRAALIVFATSG